LTVGQAEALGIGFILIWLGLETLWDLLKSLVIPIWLVLPPVLVGVAYQALFGKWYVAAAVGSAMVLHLSNKLFIRVAGTFLMLAAAFVAGNWALAAGLVLYWLLWELNVTGGADALASYAALLLVPRWEMFGFLLLGIFLWAVGTMVVVYRGKLLERFKRMALRLYLRELPTEHELSTEGKPTIGGVWIGTILFAVWSALS
jgi:hypothetical protein